jgi:hypothetical protein
MMIDTFAILYDADGDADRLELGLTDGLAECEPLGLADGLRDGLGLGLNDGLGDAPADSAFARMLKTTSSAWVTSRPDASSTIITS